MMKLRACLFDDGDETCYAKITLHTTFLVSAHDNIVPRSQIPATTNATLFASSNWAAHAFQNINCPALEAIIILLPPRRFSTFTPNQPVLPSMMSPRDQNYTKQVHQYRAGDIIHFPSKIVRGWQLTVTPRTKARRV